MTAPLFIQLIYNNLKYDVISFGKPSYKNGAGNQNHNPNFALTNCSMKSVVLVMPNTEESMQRW